MSLPGLDPGEHSPPQPRRPAASETPRLHRWLDRELRRGEAGRLAMEYPLSMGPGGSRRHRALFDRGRPIAHAMSHRVSLRAHGRRLELGLIGNVLTDPTCRGRGYATSCVDAALTELREDGAAVALLWSDATGLYARSGFHPTGRETLWDLSAMVCPPAEEHTDTGFRVARVHPRDLPAMETLYAAKPVRVDRLEGALGTLCAAPETRLAVARRANDGQVAGYAALGRGDDFRGVIHEWAGSANAVLACIRWLRRNGGAHTLLTSPVDEGIARPLSRAGAQDGTGVFALAKILDAARLWRAIGPHHDGVQFTGGDDAIGVRGPSGTVWLEQSDALELLFGRGPRAVPRLPRAERRLLGRCLPWPLYVWGFDSI